mmetsp:Transcript_4857/g.10673  ORF Transcript_4857/g.10673 Transcript_4857/m.10673 type:complete len:270 (+) Transcript_4857:61-870(+)
MLGEWKSIYRHLRDRARCYTTRSAHCIAAQSSRILPCLVGQQGHVDDLAIELTSIERVNCLPRGILTSIGQDGNIASAVCLARVDFACLLFKCIFDVPRVQVLRNVADSHPLGALRGRLLLARSLRRSLLPLACIAPCCGLSLRGICKLIPPSHRTCIAFPSSIHQCKCNSSRRYVPRQLPGLPSLRRQVIAAIKSTVRIICARRVNEFILVNLDYLCIPTTISTWSPVSELATSPLALLVVLVPPLLPSSILFWCLIIPAIPFSLLPA